MTSPNTSTEEKFYEIAPTFYGGEVGDKIQSVHLSQTGIIISQQNILKFIKDLLTLEREKVRKEIEGDASEENSNDLASWLHDLDPVLGPHIWEQCCLKFGFGGTPESNFAYKKIVSRIKQVLTDQINEKEI